MVSAPAKDDAHYSMPPAPKPCASNLIIHDENVQERPTSASSLISQSRARRRQKATHPPNEPPESPLPVKTPPVYDDGPKASNLVNNAFIEKIRQNDTLARFKRNSPTPGSVSQSDGITSLLTLIFLFLNLVIYFRQ